MSIKVMSLVWDKSQHKGSELLVLLALADWSNDQGRSVFPSVPALAKKTRLSERNVQYILRKLERTGEISTTPQAHRNQNGQNTNEYTINLSLISRGAKFAPVQPIAPEGCKPASKGVQPVAPNPSGSIIEPLESTPALEFVADATPQQHFRERTIVHGKDAAAPVGNVRRLKAHVRGKCWAVDRFIDVLGHVYIPTAEERDEIAMTVADNDPLWEKTLTDYKAHKWDARKVGKLLGYYRNGAKWPDAFGKDRDRQQTTGPAFDPGPSKLQNRRIVRWEKVPGGMMPIYEGQEGANA